jgi:hypothetical protein
MPGLIPPVIGQPGVQNGNTVQYREAFRDPGSVLYFPSGGVIAQTAQDYSNSLNPLNLRAGLMMGRVTSTKQWLPSFLGNLSAALVGTSTSLTTSAVSAAEIVRRIGTTGTFTLTGGSLAGRTARTSTITYSAVNTTSGVVTITAPLVANVDGIEALPAVDTTGSGTFTLTIEGRTTAAITYSATIATLITNINAQLNLTFGTGGIVASGASLAALVLTFQGENFNGRPILPSTNGTVTANVIATLITGSTGYTLGNNPTSSGVGAALAGGSTTSTAGVTGDSGNFIVGSMIGASDGSQVPLTVVDSGSGLLMLYNNSGPIDWPQIPYSGLLLTANLLPFWPTDTGLQQYIQNSMNQPGSPGRMGFDSLFSPY